MEALRVSLRTLCRWRIELRREAVPKKLQCRRFGADNRYDVTSENESSYLSAGSPNPTEAGMTYIQGPIPPSGPEAPRSRREVVRPTDQKPQQVDPKARRDTVSISEIARLKAKLASLPEVRHDLVERIRAEIEAGTYDTIEKVHKAAERLLQELKEEGFFS